MGVRITDLEAVALYDSVTETAFGPIFPSEEAAQDFLDFTAGRADPRLWDQAEMNLLHRLWIEHNGAQFGLELGAVRE